MSRSGALLLFCLASACSAASQAVEFPFAQFPRQLWERELVWLKNTGITTISVPNGGDPAVRDAFEGLLRRLDLSVPASEEQWPRVSAMAENSIVLSREQVVNGSPGIVWTNLETKLAPDYQQGAVSLAGDDVGSVNALRRDARIAQFWSPLFAHAEPNTKLVPTPSGVLATQLNGANASAAVLVNKSPHAWAGQVRVAIAGAGRYLQLPVLHVPPNDSLWLPVNVPLAAGAFCRQCTAFGNADRLVYSTLELTNLEFENGTLALEFYAPVEGEAVLQIAKQPTGPYLAGGRLKRFDWDTAGSRAKLLIPAGKAPQFRTRVALAMEAPEQSAFFVNAKRLLIGERNRILTSYSSEELAKRSRLKLPRGWSALSKVVSSLEIEYTIEVPASLAHGDHVEFALEADGVEMSRARIQVVRPVGLRVPEGVRLHIGTDQSLPVVPPLVPLESPTGRSITIALRNGSAEIRTYRVSIEAPGLEFEPAAQEVVVGALAERELTVRVFTKDGPPGLVRGTIQVDGASVAAQPVQFVVIPRGQTVRYQAQMDGVAGEEFVLESARVRAVFSTPRAGRCLEIVWKESGTNVLSERSAVVGDAEIDLKDTTLTLSGEHSQIALQQTSDVTTKVDNLSGATTFTLTRPAR